MEGLAVSHHDVVGDVNDIVDGTQADEAQLVLKPGGTFLHLASSQSDGAIAGTSLGVLNLHGNGERLVIHHKSFTIGAVKAGLISVLHQPGVEVARHTIVAARIGAVGGDVHLNQIVAFKFVILGGRGAYYCVLGQHDDAVVVSTDTDFVLGTNHAKAFHATQLAALDGEGFVAIVKHGSHNRHNHLLSLCHIGGTADNLNGGFATHVHATNVHVVAIGMRFASEDFSNPKTGQTSLDGLHFFHASHLKTGAGQCHGHFMGTQGGVHIFTQPFI